MENRYEFLHMIIKLVFIVLVPSFIIFFRIKKKVSTGFALGAIFMSFVISIISVASLYEDPADIFIREINAGNYEESKRLYKIIIQGGPDKLAEVNENKIIYKDNLSRIKRELISEYEEIAERIYKSVSVDEVDDCADMVLQEKNLKKLKHALNLVNYSMSIGSSNQMLHSNLTSRIDNGEKTFADIKKKCQ